MRRNDDSLLFPFTVIPMHSINTHRSDHRQCVTCGKQHGILICDGCQSTFCARHVARHRQDLTDQLEDILQDQQRLHKALERQSNLSVQFQKINQWEKESIRKIELAADRARMDLRQLMEISKRRLTKLSEQMASDMISSYKADSFSETDLTQWTKQLTELRSKMASPSSMEIVEDKQSPLYFIAIVNQFSSLGNHANRSPRHDRFVTANQSISIENDGLLIRHVGPDLDYGHVLGQRTYSQGRHTLCFQIEHSAAPYMMFFGCISKSKANKTMNYKSPSVVGWFGYNEVYQHGVWNNSVRIHGYESSDIGSNDRLQLIIDCEKKQIEWHHPRTNRRSKLSVNIDQAPLPWQLLIVLTHTDDCLRILGDG